MVDIPLLNGETIRTGSGRDIDSHPDVDATSSVVLHEDFAREQLPWWLSYQTDNGPTGPTFNGLASGDTTDVVLSTGATSNGDTTALVGPSVTWDNWKEIRFYAYGLRFDTTADATAQATLGDDYKPQNVSEGFRALDGQHDGQYLPRVRSGGNDLNKAAKPSVDFTTRHTIGARLYDNGNGHTVTWNWNGRSWENWGEGAGFPNAIDMDFSVGVRSLNGTVDHQITIDGIYIELLPY